MQIGIVIGSVWATKKEEELTGMKFLVVQPILPDGSGIGSPLVAVDRLGAGVGDRVMVTTGSSAAVAVTERRLPIDALVVGIVDSIDVQKLQ